MSDEYVDVEISLPEKLWAHLERLAKMNGITLTQLVNDIIKDELDKLDELDKKDDPG